MHFCVYCGEREAVGFEAGRLVCAHCKALPENPAEIVQFEFDDARFLTMAVQ